jgi:nucleotidyltransferase/DNA polymerase involved in DNA repair
MENTTTFRNPYRMKRVRNDGQKATYLPNNGSALDLLGKSVNTETDNENSITCYKLDSTAVDNMITNSRSSALKSIDFPDSSTASKMIMSDLVVSAADKAGMDGIDREAIDEIIQKESGNSLFMQQQIKRDEKVNQRIVDLQKKLQMHWNIIKTKEQHDVWRTNVERQIYIEMSNWLSTRPVRSCKVVVDMDMFFMACELLSRPDITPTTPACVGGTSMITTSNYAARRYGVRSAMPGYIGSTLVHQLSKGREQLIFCSLNFDLYKQKSIQVREVLSEYDPNLTAYSLDEAYMDLAPYLLTSLTHPTWTHKQISAHINQIATPRTTKYVENGDNYDLVGTSGVGDDCNDIDERNPTIYPLESCYDCLLQYSNVDCLSRMALILFDMRERVRSTTGGLTCSAGVASNFLLAKIASDMNKPNGQCLVPSDHESIVQFLHPLPIRKISGIGRVTEKVLRAFDIVTVKQLYEARALVRFLFDRNPSTCNFLIRASIGCSSDDSISADNSLDSKVTESNNQQKGISRERTIPSGKTWAEINSKLEDIACLLSEDMEKKQLSARTIYVKVKLHTFDLLSHGRTLPADVYIRSAKDLIKITTELLHEIRQNELKAKGVDKETTATTTIDGNDHSGRQLFYIRLIGIRCTNFKENRTGPVDSYTKFRGKQKTIDQFMHSNSTTLLSVTNEKLEITESGSNLSEIPSPIYCCVPVLNRYSQSPKPKLSPHLIQEQQSSINDLKKESICTNGLNSAKQHKKKLNSFLVYETENKNLNNYLLCPICNIKLHVSNPNHQNNIINRHIDTCLNRTTVRQMVREMNTDHKVQTQFSSRMTKKVKTKQSSS